MNTATIETAVKDVQTTGDLILETIKGEDPEVALPASTAEAVLGLVGNLVSTALTAFSAASGTPITVASVLALLPNDTPLTPPPAGS